MKQKSMKKARRMGPVEVSRRAERGIAEPKAGGPDAENQQQENRSISTYIFTFELIKQYPTVRSFIIKQPLKRSFMDTLSELFGGSKKSSYGL